MRIFSDRICKENQNIHFMFSNLFPENRALYDITCKNLVEPDKPQKTVWPIRIACWINKATDRHSEHVLLIAFYGNNVCKNASQCYVIPTMAVLFNVHESIDVKNMSYAWRSFFLVQMASKHKMAAAISSLHSSQTFLTSHVRRAIFLVPPFCLCGRL